MNPTEPAFAAATPAAAPRRRTLLYAAAAVGAAAGAGLAWWRLRPAAVQDQAMAALWELEFDMPNGGRLVMARLRGQMLLLNFWATWCPPCIEELPLLNVFYQENKLNGWQVLGLAVDQLAPVQAFLQRQPLDFPVALAGVEGLALSKSLGNQLGGLPFSVLISADGSILERKIGRLSANDLAAWRQLATPPR
jgi:thiol-disulfide isomerase/thioredoxin